MWKMWEAIKNNDGNVSINKSIQTKQKKESEREREREIWPLLYGLCRPWLLGRGNVEAAHKLNKLAAEDGSTWLESNDFSSEFFRCRYRWQSMAIESTSAPTSGNADGRASRSKWFRIGTRIGAIGSIDPIRENAVEAGGIESKWKNRDGAASIKRHSTTRWGDVTSELDRNGLELIDVFLSLNFIFKELAFGSITDKLIRIKSAVEHFFILTEVV